MESKYPQIERRLLLDSKSDDKVFNGVVEFKLEALQSLYIFTIRSPWY